MRRFQQFLVMAIAIGTTSAFAGMCSSGGIGSSFGGIGFGSATVHTRAMSTDRTYRLGRSAFSKRDANGDRIRYCLMVDGEAKRITKTRIRSLQGGSVDDFAHALVDCADPDRLALMRVADRQKIPHILYYLAAHYEVSLVRLSPEERLARRAERAMRGAVAAN